MIKSFLKSTHINTLFLCFKNNQSCLECGICQTEMDDPSKHWKRNFIDCVKVSSMIFRPQNDRLHLLRPMLTLCEHRVGLSHSWYHLCMKINLLRVNVLTLLHENRLNSSSYTEHMYNHILYFLIWKPNNKTRSQTVCDRLLCWMVLEHFSIPNLNTWSCPFTWKNKRCLIELCSGSS